MPIYDTVAEAVAATGATASFIAVPPKAASAAILEAAAAGIGFIVCITEGIPAQDEAKVFNTLVRDFPNTRLLGPNCPGIISPGKCNIGITAGEIAQLPTADGPNVGIVSRSGTLTYQALYELKQRGIGVSTCVGIGGDPVPGTNFIDCLSEFQADPETHAIILIGEIGGSAEEEAAAFIESSVTKPMSAYIAGVTAPAGKKMGHAGAIVSGGKGTAQGKMDALRAAGVHVGLNPTEAGDLMADIVASLADLDRTSAAPSFCVSVQTLPRLCAVTRIAGRTDRESCSSDAFDDVARTARHRGPCGELHGRDSPVRVFEAESRAAPASTSTLRCRC